jgi:hypothetical protein
MPAKKKSNKIKTIKSVKETRKKNVENKKVIKDKYLAILLSIISGPLFWIYTYREDKNKLLIGLLCAVLLCWTIVVPIGVYIWAIVDAATKEDITSKYYKWVY